MPNHPNRRFSDNERRKALADSATATPRSPGGLTVALQVTLYTKTPGYSVISDTHGAPALLNCRSDEELIREFSNLVGLLRQRQQQQAA